MWETPQPFQVSLLAMSSLSQHEVFGQVADRHGNLREAAEGFKRTPSVSMLTNIYVFYLSCRSS